MAEAEERPAGVAGSGGGRQEVRREGDGARAGPRSRQHRARLGQVEGTHPALQIQFRKSSTFY